MLQQPLQVMGSATPAGEKTSKSVLMKEGRMCITEFCGSKCEHGSL